MKINIRLNIEKKYVFMIVGAILMVAGAMFGYAYINPTTKVGHDITEIGAPAGCLNGPVLKYNGVTWVCADDVGVGSVAGSVTLRQSGQITGALLDSGLNIGASCIGGEKAIACSAFCTDSRSTDIYTYPSGTYCYAFAPGIGHDAICYVIVSCAS